MREIQRNYNKILERARRERRPIFLGPHGSPKAVIMDIKDFEKLEKREQRAKRRSKWQEIERVLNHVANQGRQSISLSDFILHDRQSH